MLFEQVQRVILAKKIFWGYVHLNQGLHLEMCAEAF